jgi:hypothetical protein
MSRDPALRLEDILEAATAVMRGLTAGFLQAHLTHEHRSNAQPANPGGCPA